MNEEKRLPKLLGREPDIMLNENDISAKIQANFNDGFNTTQTFSDDNKNSTSFVRPSRYVQLNSEDVYEISNTGAIKAIKSNESILSNNGTSQSKRPKSGRFRQRRPWSNRSYKRTDSGSVGSRPGSSKNNKVSVVKSHSVNSRKLGQNPLHKSYLSKVDHIIQQTHIYNNSNTGNKRITRKYNKLRSHESIDSNMAAGESNLNNSMNLRRSSNRSNYHRNSSGNRENSLIRITKMNSTKFINGISTTLLTNLFNAKCNDLKIHPKDGQLRRFLEYCQKAMKDRKITFREIGFGPNSAKVLGNILRYNRFSHLDLRKNVLGNQGLRELSKSLLMNSSLIHLDIGSNDITFEGANSFFKSMIKHKTLTSISIANSDGLHRNRIRAKGCIGLNHLLKKNKIISMLNLSGNNIGKEGVKIFLKDLDPVDMNLVYLNLTNNDLGFDCIRDLRPLFESPALSELRLSNNKLDDSTAEAISSYFYKEICKMKKIDLSCNNITSKGACILFRSLKQNRFLTHLNLRNNQFIGNGELLELENFLNNNQCLTHLNLGECGLDSKHIYIMCEGLHAKESTESRIGNNTLHNLNLTRNKIDDEGADHIAEILKHDTNTGLMVIDLSSNFISDEAAANLTSAMETNNHLLKLNLKNNNCMAKWCNNDNSMAVQNRLPKIREEMSELLLKEEEQMKAGDKNFNFGKVMTTMKVKKTQLESDMTKYQDWIEKMRDNDEVELDQLKSMLKNLKENSEDMDYDLIRLAKARERRKKNLRYQIEDVQVDIYNVKKSEGDRRKELQEAKNELQEFQDIVDVQVNKLQKELEEAELERKKAQFVYENYEREVTRWRKEVEDKKNQSLQANFLSIPTRSAKRKGSTSRSHSRSHSRSKSKKKEKIQPFQRITKRSINYVKENDPDASNIPKDTRLAKSKPSKKLKKNPKRENSSKQRLNIRVNKSLKRKKIR
ncbi:unnamed protein product [Moneuplotes crassus]|uniref:Leucine-rich repeat protein n=1 Tax=Euplotes crassus TaxID=5936 RepID=A0AAD1Y1B0_EUPCR|nr:unnamed protein product [Moneuplotes crassus]